MEVSKTVVPSYQTTKQHSEFLLPWLPQISLYQEGVCLASNFFSELPVWKGDVFLWKISVHCFLKYLMGNEGYYFFLELLGGIVEHLWTRRLGHYAHTTDPVSEPLLLAHVTELFPTRQYFSEIFSEISWSMRLFHHLLFRILANHWYKWSCLHTATRATSSSQNNAKNSNGKVA
jgi:hypothetical protein